MKKISEKKFIWCTKEVTVDLKNKKHHVESKQYSDLSTHLLVII